MRQMKHSIYKHSYKSKWFDTHCHLEKTLPKLKHIRKDGYHLNQFPRFVDENCFGNFGGCITISCSASSYKPITSMINNDTNDPIYKKLFASYGCHPHYAKDWTPQFRKQTLNALTLNKAIAVGECGLDYYRLLTPADIQKQVFIDQIKMSRDLNLPLIVHSRKAEQDTIDIMTQFCDKNQNIHLHCFTDSIQMADIMLNRFPNLCIGFTGVITFDSAKHNRELVEMVPLERILLETDSPYMAPKPYRGTSHSGYIPIIAETVASVKDIEDVERVLEICSNNAIKLYKLPN